MPELLEVEYYRRLAEGALGRAVTRVSVPDPHVLAPPATVRALRRALVGRQFVAARRRGKLLLLDTGPAPGEPVPPEAARPAGRPVGPTLGVRFGMTGGLVVDDRMAIDRLLYGPGTFGGQWIRCRVHFADGGALALHDPRRFGRLLVDPDEGALGPDAMTVSAAALRSALAGRTGRRGAPLKARLLDQSRLAGIGNLLADEILWRASLAPARPAGSLTAAELRRLHGHLRSTVDELLERGGSHTGDLMAARRPGGHCPRDGEPLVRSTVGGRTTWWCPAHQH